MAEKQQDIHTGMKMTETGWIPKDWVCKQIGTTGYTYNGITGKTKSDFGVGNARYITFLNILNNPQIDIKILERVNITDKDGQNAVIKGDLFFNTSSETPEEVGICSTLTEEVQNVYLNSFCFGLRLTDKELDGLYLSYYFRSQSGRALMTMLAQGATRYNLSKENFNKSYIGVPSTKNEQHRIAQVLSDMDMLIASLSRTIEKKRLMKQGAMQQLLTGKTRLKGFKGEWVEKKLKEIVDVKKGFGLSKAKLSLDGKYRCILYGELFTTYDYLVKKCVSRTNYFEGTLSKAGDVLMPGSTTTSGIDLAKAVSVYSDDILLGGDVIILRSKTEFLYDSFFLACMLTVIKRTEVEQAAQGITIIHLNVKELANITLQLPNDIKEQTAISEHLRTMDNEIESLEIELQKYKALKQGMMQKLLTGQIRLSYGKES